MRFVVSLFLLLGAALAGCQSIDGGDGLEKGVPYQLNTKEIAAVEKGLYKQLPYEGVLIFGPALASKDSKGYVSVCGTISSFGGINGMMSRRPYVGMMVNVPPLFGFVPIVIANESSDNQSAVFLTCHRKGIPI